MKHWVVSCALHGTAVLGAVALAWSDPPVEAIREPLRWQVALADSEPPPRTLPAREPPIPGLPMPTAPAMTAPWTPADSAAEPPAETVPPPAGPGTRASTPEPGPTVPLPEPVPPSEPRAPPPPLSLPAVAQPAPAPARSIQQVALTPVAASVPATPSSAPADPRPAPAAPAPPAPMVKAAVPTSPPPVPDPRPPAAAEAERRWYLALLEQLRDLQRYPPAARRLSQEGIVLVEARIGPDGRLEDAAVKRGSGYPLLDRDALRLLETAAEAARGRLRPERPTRLEIPIAYRLEG